MLPNARVLAEKDAYVLRLTMLQLSFAEGRGQSLVPSALGYADHLRSLKAEAPPVLHPELDTLIREYEAFAKACSN